MTYLLDTNVCIALINGEPAAVRNRFQKLLSAGNQFFVSSVSAFELWYGAYKSARMEANALLLKIFFAGPVSLLPFDDEDARSAGEIRAALEAVGRPIGAYDLLISGQALRRKMTLVTANEREFRRLKGLVWMDWARS
ncbi:MAG: type II toxin-antitoxin system VapC family toxin [Acidobacteria bacterium]|nr:type II toxin-antitoxin system VapC family toxin [Acidobacteriota bacterium]